MTTIYEQMLGALYGHAYGDASGARLEFRGIPSECEIKRAMELSGGGVFNLSPGQVTDDGELTLQVFRALYEYFLENTDTELDELFFRRFKEWFDSNPFDIGHTTRNAFQGATTHFAMSENVTMLNINSESNGALMRSIPHAIFAYAMDLDEDQLYDLVQMDVQLTHVKQCVIHLVYAYCIIILYIFQGKNNTQIFERLTRLGNDLDDLKLTTLLENYNAYSDVTHNVGWDKHAFSLVLYCLFNNYSFEHSIEYTLSLGGDTDTNAAIVGGVMGAKYGSQAIPFIDKLFNSKGRVGFHPKEYIEKVINLLAVSRQQVGNTFPPIIPDVYTSFIPLPPDDAVVPDINDVD
jgi:ADP-ribosyl-[dinitrogen reductase] hydrolase